MAKGGRTTGRTVIQLMAWVCFLLPGLAIHAGTDLSQQRKHFLVAEKALKEGNPSTFLTLESELVDYPLYPYLLYQKLITDLPYLDSTEVDQFLTRYQATPLARKARKLWLSELFKRKKWWAYLVFHQPNLGRKFDCQRVQALFNSGRSETALEEIPSLWLSGSSLPDECDQPLTIWIDAGELSNTLVWQRFELAISAKKRGLAKYLTRFFDNEQDKALAAKWLKAIRNPEIILTKNTFSPSVHPKIEQKIVLQGFKRLLRTAPDKAIANWQLLATRYSLTEQQRYQGQRAILLQHIRSDEPDAIARLAQFKAHESDLRFQEARLRYGLSKQAWPQIRDWISALPTAEQQTERWQYWMARSLNETGEKKAAEQIYFKLAKERSYHGFRSADIVGLSYNIDHVPLDIDDAQRARIMKWPSVQRARELLHFERYTDARREWRFATRGTSKLELKQLATIAQQWKWHDQAIFTLARTGYWDDLEIRFPLQHKHQVAQTASQQQISKAWVFAVIRQESAFSPNAVSRTGARGLMQLMPKTAAYIAKKVKHPAPSRRDLNQPDINIKLGTAYLQRVYSQLGEHQALATAAYNAGPHRVQSWLPEQGIDADIWIETIPFKETRRYTERVLYYTTIYEQRLGLEQTRLSSRTPKILPESQIAKAAQLNVNSAAL